MAAQAVANRGSRARAVAPTARVEDWTLTERTTRIWTALSLVVTVLAIPLFGLISTRGHGADLDVSSRGWALLGAVVLTTVLTLPLYLVHEAIHGQVMRAFGARPAYGWGQVGGIPGYLYCTGNHARFGRRQYVAIALAPCLLISILGALAAALLPSGGWLVVPLAFHFGGCVGDFWAVVLILRRPRGTTVEDLATGVRFHLPGARREA